MKKSVTYKPLSNKEYSNLIGKFDLTNVFLLTGARIAEVTRILNQWDGESDYIDIKTKKSTGTNRIQLLDKVKKSITNWRLNREKKGLKLNDISTKLVDREIGRISDSVGIKFTSHQLRATFASQLLQNGVDIVSVSTLMNHSDISITARYIQFNEDGLRASLESLNSIKTIDGMTMLDLKKANTDLLRKIRRLERKLKESE